MGRPARDWLQLAPVHHHHQQQQQTGHSAPHPGPHHKSPHSLFLRQAAELHRTLICCRVLWLNSALPCSLLWAAEAALSDTRGSVQQRAASGRAAGSDRLLTNKPQVVVGSKHEHLWHWSAVVLWRRRLLLPHLTERGSWAPCRRYTCRWREPGRVWARQLRLKGRRLPSGCWYVTPAGSCHRQQTGTLQTRSSSSAVSRLTCACCPAAASTARPT